MAIADKFDRFPDGFLKRLSIFVLSMDSEIREAAEDAVKSGVEDPLIWLVDCHDSVGIRLANEWGIADVMDGRPDSEFPYAVTRAVSHRKAKERFGRLPIDLKIPDPSASHIDVLAVTEGGIFVTAIPRDPTMRDVWPGPGEVVSIVSGIERAFEAPSMDLMLQAIVEPVDRTQEGELIRAVALPWLAIVKEIERNPDFLANFARHPRRFEEFIAATYERDGWPEVILTPRSGDGGVDVIATRPGIGSIRFLDQCKAYSPGHLVTHLEVQAMLGALSSFPNASKGIITTTSDFQPQVSTASAFSSFIPNRLELRSGEELRKWLAEIAKRRS